MPIDENGREFIFAADGKTHLLSFIMLGTVCRRSLIEAVQTAEQVVDAGYGVEEARILGDDVVGAVAELRRMVFEEAMKDDTVKAAADRYTEALVEHRHTGKLTHAIHRDDLRRSFYETLGAWVSDNIYGDPRGPHHS